MSCVQEREGVGSEVRFPLAGRALAPSPACVVPDGSSSPCFLLSVDLSPIVTLAKGEHGAGRQTRVSLSPFLKSFYFVCLVCSFGCFNFLKEIFADIYNFVS